MKMDIKKSPMDIVEKARSDGTMNKQCRAAHWQSTKTTVTHAHTDFADIPKPSLSQRPAVAAEEARTIVLQMCSVGLTIKII